MSTLLDRSRLVTRHQCGAARSAWIDALGLVVIAIVVIIASWVGSTDANIPRAGPRTSPAENATGPSDAQPATTELSESAMQGDRHIVDAREPDAVGEALTLHLSTVTSLVADVRPVPHIALEVGIESPTVAKPPALLRCTTDDNGQADVAVPLATIQAARAQGLQRLWVRVATPRYQARITYKMFPDGMSAIPLRIVAIEGVTLRGRVIDADGKPVAAKIRAAPLKADGTLAIPAVAEARDDGWFEVSPYQQGVHEILADAGDRGTGVVRGIKLSLDAQPDPIEVRVGGTGVVRGHMRDSEGRPSGGFDLLVILAELDDDAGSVRLKEPRSTNLELEGRGRTWALTRTDGQGAFEVHGLRSDAFNVRAGPDHGSSEYPVLLTRPSVPSNGAELALLYDRPHIVVHVENEDHSVWKGSCIGQHPTRGEDLSWPMDAIVVVKTAREDARVGRLTDYRLNGVCTKAGEFVFDVPTQRRFLVGLWGGKQAWNPVKIAVPAGAGRMDVTLVARDAPSGKLSLSVGDAQGQPLPTNVVVRIEDVKSGLVMALEENDQGWRRKIDQDVRRQVGEGYESRIDNPQLKCGWPMQFELPEGEYRVAVEGAASVDDYHGTMMAERTHGRFETNVRVVHDRETSLKVTLPLGARVQLKLQGFEKPEDLAALDADDPGSGGLFHFSNLATIALLSDDHWPQPVMFRWEMTGSSAAGTHLRSELPVGTEGTSELVSSGKFRIEARMPGGRTASSDIVLVDGQTTDVTLHID